MKASDFVTEKKKRKKRKPRWAAYGPGPYGGYGFAVGYSGSDGGGDAGGGVGEASYPGNIGIMELTKFFQTATDKEKDLFQTLLEKGKKGLAWKLIQDSVGVKLQGKEFEKGQHDDEGVEEGLKDTLWNLGISSAIAVGAVGGLTIKQALTSPTIPLETKREIVQQVKLPSSDIRTLISQIEKEKQQIKTSAGPTTRPKLAPRNFVVQNMTDSPLEDILRKEAIRSGIKGVELAAFMAQCAHESHDFKTLVEYGGSLDFRKYDPKYAPKKAKSLGNTKAGDGARYKGRGFIQLTGRYNYRKAGQELGLPLEKHPELAEKPEVAAKIAVWFWEHRVQPNVDNYADVKAVTKPINPSMNGLADRKDNFKTYMQVAMR